jgi:hypothetical protein
LEDIPTTPYNPNPYSLTPVEYKKFMSDQESAAYAQSLADSKAQAGERDRNSITENAALVQTEVDKVQQQIEGVNAQRAANEELIQASNKTIEEYGASIVPEISLRDPGYLQGTRAYMTAIDSGISEEGALQAATKSIAAQNARLQQIVDQATQTRDSATAYAKVLDAHVESLNLAQDDIAKNSFIYNGKIMTSNTEVYSAYLAAVDVYAAALAANTITPVGQAAIELQSRINRTVGNAIYANTLLLDDQKTLASQLTITIDSISAYSTINNILVVPVKESIAQDKFNEYRLFYYLTKNPTSEYYDLKNQQDFIDRYGKEDGFDRFDAAIVEGGQAWEADKLKVDQKLAELNLDKSVITSKMVENNLKINNNRLIANETIIYNTNLTEGRKLLDKMLEVNPPDGTPYIILTDSRKPGDVAAENTIQIPPTATAVGSSPNYQMAVEIAQAELRRKLAVELYGDAGKAFMIELTDIKQPVTETKYPDGKIMYTANVTASTPVAVRELTTDVTITYISLSGQIKTETISFSKATDGYLSPSDAAGRVYAKFFGGGNEILGIVANTSNKVLKIRV